MQDFSFNSTLTFFLSQMLSLALVNAKQKLQHATISGKSHEVHLKFL